MRDWGDAIALPPPYLYWVDVSRLGVAGGTAAAERRRLPWDQWRSWRVWPWVGAHRVVSAGLLTACVTLTAAFAGWLDRLPLLNPVLAAVVEISASAALVVSWWRRDRRWWGRRLPLVVFAAATLTGLIAAYLRLSRTVVDAYPVSFFLWVGLAFVAVIGVPVTVPGRDRAQRMIALTAVPLTAAGAFLLINDQYGLWPRVGALLGHNGAVSTDELYRQLHLPAGARQGDKGVMASIDIPADRSGFVHRSGSVYLPPAFFTEARTNLPILLMLTGTPGTPEHWASAGGATATADAFAATHRGVAPIMLFVDHNGSATGDTECVDGPQGNAETYLSADVPAFAEKTLRLPHNPERWGIVGFSEGGTCALVLTLVHPQVFRYFIDIAGDDKPMLGDAKNTLAALFGGSVAARDAHDPALLMANHRYDGITAWFAVGDDDVNQRATSHSLALAAAKAGATVHEFTAGGGHDWPFGAEALRQIMPRLCKDLGAL